MPLSCQTFTCTNCTVDLERHNPLVLEHIDKHDTSTPVYRSLIQRLDNSSEISLSNSPCISASFIIIKRAHHGSNFTLMEDEILFLARFRPFNEKVQSRKRITHMDVIDHVDANRSLTK